MPSKGNIPDESISSIPPSPPQKTADKPHPVTVRLGIFSPAIAVVALLVAFLSWHTSERSMKVGQRAYLTYQSSITNASQVIESLHADKDFFLSYQVVVTNMGNTPAESIYPKINVLPDPDREPIMVTFPTSVEFDLGPKESRVLNGQALFKHVRNVRRLPGFSTGFAGVIEYKDVFGDRQKKQVCYQFIALGNAPSSGVCGTVMQMLQMK